MQVENPLNDDDDETLARDKYNKRELKRNLKAQGKKKKKRKGYATGGFVEDHSGQDSVDAKLAGGEVVLSHKHLLSMAKILKVYDKYDNDEDRIRETGKIILAMGGKNKYKDGLQSMGDFKVKKGWARTSIQGNGTSMDLSSESMIDLSKQMGIYDDFKNDKDRIARVKKLLQDHAQNGGETKDTSRSHSGVVKRRNKRKDPSEVQGKSRRQLRAAKHQQNRPSVFDNIKTQATEATQRGFDNARDAEVAWREGNFGAFAKEKMKGVKSKLKDAGSKAKDYGKFYLGKAIKGDLKGMFNAMMVGTYDSNGKKVKKGLLDKASDTVKSVGASIKKWSDKHLMGDKTTTKDKDGKDVTTYEGGFFSPIFQFGNEVATKMKDKFFGANGVINKFAGKLLDGVDSLLGRNKGMKGLTISERLQARLFGGKGEKFGGIIGSMKKGFLVTSKTFFGNIFGFKGLKKEGQRDGGLLQYIGKNIIGRSLQDFKSIISGDRYDKSAKKKTRGEKSIGGTSTADIRGKYGDKMKKQGLGRDASFTEIYRKTKEERDKEGSGMPTVDYVTENLRHSLIDNLVRPTLEIASEFKDFSKAMLTEAKTFLKKSIEAIRQKSMDVIGFGFKTIAKMVGRIPLVKKTMRGLSSTISKVTGGVGNVLTGVASKMRNQSVKTGTLSIMDAASRDAAGTFKSRQAKHQDKIGGIRGNIKRLEANRHLSPEEKKQLKEAKKYVSEYDLVKKERKMSRGEARLADIKAIGRRKTMMAAKGHAAKDYQAYKAKQMEAGVAEDKILPFEAWAKNSKHGKFLTDEYQRSTLTVANKIAQADDKKKAEIVGGELANIKDSSPELAVADKQLDEMKKHTTLFESIADKIGAFYDNKIGGMTSEEVKKKYAKKEADRVASKTEKVDESPKVDYDDGSYASDDNESDIDLGDYDFNNPKEYRRYKKDMKKVQKSDKKSIKNGKKLDKKVLRRLKKRAKLDKKAHREQLKSDRKTGIGGIKAAMKRDKLMAKSASLSDDKIDLGTKRAKELQKQMDEKKEHNKSLLSGITSMAGNLGDALAKKGWLRVGFDKIKSLFSGFKKLLTIIPMALAALGIVDIWQKFKDGAIGDGFDKTMQFMSSVAKKTKLGKKAVSGAVKKVGGLAIKGVKKVGSMIGKSALGKGIKGIGSKIGQSALGQGVKAAKTGAKGLIGKVFKFITSKGPLKKILKGGTKKVVGELVEASAKKAGPKLLDRLGAKVAGAALSGGVTFAATAATDYLVGSGNSANYFELGPGEKPTKSMKMASGAANAISGALFGLAPTGMLAKLIYGKLASPEEQAKAAASQQGLTDMANEYGVDKKGLNKVVNQTAGSKIADFFTTKKNETERKMKTLGITDKNVYYALQKDQAMQKFDAKAEGKDWSQEKYEKERAKYEEKINRKYSELGDLPIMTKLSSAIGNIFGNVKKFFGNIPKFLGNVMKRIAKGIAGVVKKGAKFIGGIKDFVVGGIKNGLAKVKDFIQPIIDKVKKFFKPVTDALDKVVSGVKKFLKPVADFFTMKFEELGIFKAVEKIKGLFGGIAGAIKDKIKGALGWLGDKLFGKEEETDEYTAVSNRDNVATVNEDGSPKFTEGGARIDYITSYNDALYAVNAKARKKNWSGKKYAKELKKLETKYRKYKEKGKVESPDVTTEKNPYSPPKDGSPKPSYGDVTGTNGNVTSVNFNRAETEDNTAYASYGDDHIDTATHSNELANRTPPVAQQKQDRADGPSVVEESLKLIVDMMSQLLNINSKILATNATGNAKMVSIASGIPSGGQPMTGLSKDAVEDIAELRKRAERLVSGL